MKASARSQKIRVVTESDYIEFMKCPMKAHDSLIAERLFHDIPSCSPPTNITKASTLPPPGPPPGPLAPSITSWSSPVKIYKPGQTQAHDAIFQDICSPPSKICKAGKDLAPGDGTTNVVTGFNIEQSFRRLSCEENNDSNGNKKKENNECVDSENLTQKENINTKDRNLNENILSKKKNKDPNKSDNFKNNKNENPWITVKGKTGPCSQPRAKTNKENKSINPVALQLKLANQLSEGTKGKSEGKLPSQDFTTKFALRLLQNQPQTQHHHHHHHHQQQQQQQQQQPQQQQQHERWQRQKQHIDKKENNDKQRGNVKYQWRLGGQRDPRFQPEWRAASEQDYDSSKMQQLLRKRRRSGGKLQPSVARAAVSVVTGAVPQNIPPRRVTINSPEELPSDYGTTPGGTIFSTTPGGTRIIYERKFLIQCRQSPLAKTPPANLPHIPGVTTKDPDAAPPRENGTIPEEPEKTDLDSDEQFEMDL